MNPLSIALRGLLGTSLDIALLGFNPLEEQSEFSYEPIVADVISVDYQLFADVVPLDIPLLASSVAEGQILGFVGENSFVNTEGVVSNEPCIVAGSIGPSSLPSSTAKKNIFSKATIISLTPMIQATVKKT